MYVRSLTPEEIASPIEKQSHLDFDIEVEQKLGPSMTKVDFKDDPDFADFKIVIFCIYFNCACTEPIIPYTQQTDRYSQYPAPACTTLLYFNGTPRSENPILAFSRRVGLPYL
jgi:hypothetical protein